MPHNLSLSHRRWLPTAVLATIALLALVLSAARPRPVTAGPGDGPAIVGGEEAEPGAWPWQVALVSAGSDPTIGQYCGGVLLSEEWIVTAAHCVDGRTPSSFDVWAGLHNLRFPEPGHQKLAVAEIVVHPDYGGDLHTNDVAVVRLAEAADLRPGDGQTLPIQAIRLVEADAGDLAGRMTTVTGWGNRAAQPDPGGSDFPDTLHQVQVPVITNAECAGLYPLETIEASMICAGYPQGGKDSCYGDSGGPMVLSDAEDGWLLGGLTSWGYGCAQPGLPGVYARMSTLHPWVLSTTGIVYEPDFELVADPTTSTVCAGELAAIQVDLISLLAFNEVVTLTTGGLPAGASTFTPRKLAPPGESLLTVQSTALSPGNHPFTLRGRSATRQHQLPLDISVDAQPPASAQLLVPPDGATNVDGVTRFEWAAAAGARSYLLEVARDAAFSEVVVSTEVNAPDTAVQLTMALQPETSYYWRVTPRNACGQGDPSAPYQMTTALAYCVSPNKPISYDDFDGVTSRITIDSDAFIGDLDVTLIVDHTWIGDLNVSLSHPQSETNINLLASTSCGGDNVTVTLDDEAELSYDEICEDAPALFGTARPFEALSTFDGGRLAGDWQLTIYDNAPEDDGKLVSWCLKPEETDLCGFITQIPASECRALLDLYESTNGDGWWNHEDWMETRRPCGWNGVTCEAGSVAEINLINNRLRGTLPGSLADLSAMRFLYISYNPQLGGMLPPALAALDLEGLWYDRTGICTSSSPLVEAWLAGIPDLRRTNTSCSQGWLPLVRR